jgi:DNA-binding PadR family transcriptional regulator
MRHVSDSHDVSENKPLTEPVFLILASLAEEPRHGYALLQDIREMSSDRVVLSTGTLYGALRRLLDERWIERFAQLDTSRDKQAYRLTAEGKQALQTEVNRMKHLTRLAASRLKGMET